MPHEESTTAAGRAMDRRTALAGAAGALAGVALTRPGRAGAANDRFDPALARKLQQALDGAVAGSNGAIPGTIVHVERAGRGSWTGTSGLGRLDPATKMRPGDRFAAGSVIKPFVSATALQLVERGR